MRRTGLAALAVVSTVSVAGVATAASPNSSSPERPRISATLADNVNRAFRENGTPDPPKRTTPPKRSAAELDRFKRSRSEHRGKVTAAEVRKEIARRSPALVASDAIVPPKSEIDEVVAANAIRVRDKNGKRTGVMVSSLPVAENTGSTEKPTWELADLDWRQTAGRYRVSRPIVPVSAPEKAGGSLLIGGLAMRLAPAGSTATASADGENVVYANASTDTDLLVRSLPIGVGVAWQLRSPEADRSITVPFDLPAGQRLKETTGGSASIVDEDDRPVGAVSIASARDAAGQSVLMETKVSASSITYNVKPDADETQWPINVDPDVYYDVNWRTGSTNYDGWSNLSTPRGNAAQPFQYFQSVENLPTSQGGLGIFTAASTNYQQIQPNVWGEAGAWTRFAPGNPDAPGTVQAGTGRKLSPDHAIWYRFDAGSLLFGYAPTVWYHGSNYLRPRIGFLDRDGNADASSKWQVELSPNSWGPENNGYVNDLGNGTNGVSGRVYLTNPNAPDSNAIAGKTDNMIGIGLVDQVGNNGGWWPDRPSTSLAMGWYRAYAVDAVDPTLTVHDAPTDWVSSLESVKVSSVDHGVGVQKIGLRDDFGNVLSSVPITCAPTANKLCPWNIDNADLPIPDLGEGIRTGNIAALDAGGRYKAQNVTLKLDKTAPTIDLGGTMYTQRSTRQTATEPNRTITVTARDGNPAANATPSEQRSGVAWIAIFVDGKQKAFVEQTAAGDSKALSASWTPTDDSFVTNDHQVQIVTGDRLGHQSEAAFFAGFDDQSPTAISDLGANFDSEDPAGQQVDVSWAAATDVQSSNGTEGSGVVAYRYRWRQVGGTFTDWTLTGDTSFDPPNIGNGATLDIEVRPFDMADNAGPITSSTVTVTNTVTSLDSPGTVDSDPTPVPMPVSQAGWEPSELLETDEPDALPEPTPSASQGPDVSVDGRAVARSGYSETNCRGASRCGSYSPRLAVKHARYYWDRSKRRDKSYPDNGNNDCANFISQSLHKGGLRFMRAGGKNVTNAGSESFKYQTGEHSWWTRWTRNFLSRKYFQTHSWSLAQQLYNQLSEESQRGDKYSRTTKLRRGDLIFVNFNGTGDNHVSDTNRINHSMIVTRVVNGRAWVAYHSNDSHRSLKGFVNTVSSTSGTLGQSWNMFVVRPRYAVANIG